MADPMTRDAMTRDEMIETLTSVQASCHACRWRDEVAALASVIAALRAPAVTEGVKNAKEEVANIEAHIRALLPESYLESIGANVQAPNHKRELHHRCMRIFADLADRLRAPAVTGEAYRAVRRLRHAVVRMWTRLDGEPGNQASVALWKMLTDEVDAALRAAPPAEDCHCGDGATLRGYIREYGETPAMTASNRKHWKRRAEAAEAKLAAPPAGAGAPPCPSCVSERGKPDAACATCHGSGRCPSAGAPPALVALVDRWREEADGVQAMGYSQQADRMRDCAEELAALLARCEGDAR